MTIKYENKYLNEAVKLFIDIFTNEPWNFDWMSEENITRYFIHMENTPYFMGFLYIEPNGQLIGVCFGLYSDYFSRKTFEIKEIVIKRKAQGKGCGKNMMTEICNCLKNKGVEIITLATQRNIPAFGFYKKNGFQVSPNTLYMSKKI